LKKLKLRNPEMPHCLQSDRHDFSLQPSAFSSAACDFTSESETLSHEKIADRERRD
jgi:hypothetical protein